MLERRRAGALAAGVLGAVTLFSACAVENQISGIDVIDCVKGPKIGDQTTTLPFDKPVQIGGTTGGIGNRESIYVGFAKGNGVSIQKYESTHPIIYFPFDEPQLGVGEVGIYDGVIYFRDEKADYKITPSTDLTGGTLKIHAECQSQAPKPSQFASN